MTRLVRLADRPVAVGPHVAGVRRPRARPGARPVTRGARPKGDGPPISPAAGWRAGGAAPGVCTLAVWCTLAAPCLLSAPAFAAPDGGVVRLGPAPAAHLKRVITIAPSLTATLVALGATDRLVGVSRFDEAPEVAGLPRVGGFSDPSIETVVALKPDLVLVQKAPGNQRPVEAMARLGLSVVAVPLTSVGDVLDSLRTIGELLGRGAQGEALASGIEASRAKVRADSARQPTRPRVLFVYGFKPLVVAGPGSFAHELLLDAGADNLAQKAPTAYPVFSTERALALKPEVVIDASDVADGREELKALLAGARWVSLPSKALLQPGPSLGQGLEELAAMVRGDLLDAHGRHVPKH